VRDLFRIFVDILLPVFLLVGTGAIAGRRLRLDARTLTALAYWLTGPAFVFQILADANLGAALVGRIVLASLIGIGATGLLAVGIAKAARRPASVVSATLLSSIYGNVGNFGLAIVAFTFGDASLATAGIVLIVVNVVGLVVGITSAGWERHGVGTAVWRALTAPMTLAAIPGLLVAGTGATLPLWLDRAVGLLAAAMIPTMLLTLGVQLAGMSTMRPSWDTIRALGGRLVVAPLAAWAATLLVGLSGTAAGVVILQFAMPPAVFTALVAIEHELEPDLVTTTVLVGTLASLATLPVVIFLLR